MPCSLVHTARPFGGTHKQYVYLGGDWEWEWDQKHGMYKYLLACFTCSFLSAEVEERAMRVVVKERGGIEVCVRKGL